MLRQLLLLRIVLTSSALWEVSEKAYKSIIHSSDQMKGYQEQFSSLPRAVLECLARDQLLPEAETWSLQNRLHCIESDMRMFVPLLRCASENCCSSLSYRILRILVVGRLPLLCELLVASCKACLYRFKVCIQPLISLINFSAVPCLLEVVLENESLLWLYLLGFVARWSFSNYFGVARAMEA